MAYFHFGSQTGRVLAQDSKDPRDLW